MKGMAAEIVRCCNTIFAVALLTLVKRFTSETDHSGGEGCIHAREAACAVLGQSAMEGRHRLEKEVALDVQQFCCSQQAKICGTG